MTSVERVNEYTKLPSERSLETKPEILKKLPKSWGNRGVINFKNVSLKYSDDGNFVLRNLSFEIHEKVGKFQRKFKFKCECLILYLFKNRKRSASLGGEYCTIKYSKLM